MGEWVGVAGSIREGETDTPNFQELYSGWYGGALLDERMQPARRVAKTSWPVVIQGETGTGKEGAARAIHAWSGRRGLFVPVDCGALPSELAESQLFGHRKGAFTGADQAALGYFRAAQGGTIFLDEILNLSLVVQAKLLRVLADNQVVPVGEATPLSVDVRIISAAQKPLTEAVDEGGFRSDLMARLESCVVELPVLRDRREDIFPLFCKLFQLHSGAAPRCDAKFVEALLLYMWPRHVRELSQETRQLLVQHGDTDVVFTKSMLPLRIQRSSSPAPLSQAEVAQTIREAASIPKRKKYDERDFEACRKALQEHGDNVRDAARALGWEPGRVYRVMDAYEKALRKGTMK
jgi:DNA-binding NtrC family response regulator